MVQFIMEQVARKINTCLLSGWSVPGDLHAPSFNLFNNTSPFYRERNTHTQGEIVSWKVAEPGFKPCPAWLEVWAHLLCHYLLKPQKRPFGHQTGKYSGLLWASTWTSFHISDDICWQRHSTHVMEFVLLLFVPGVWIHLTFIPW